MATFVPLRREGRGLEARRLFYYFKAQTLCILGIKFISGEEIERMDITPSIQTTFGAILGGSVVIATNWLTARRETTSRRWRGLRRRISGLSFRCEALYHGAERAGDF